MIFLIPRLFVAALLSLALCSSASAFEGRYGGKSGTLVIKQRSGGALEVNVDATRPGCIAEITATGRVTNDVLVVTKSEFGSSCRLTLRKQGNSIAVSQAPGCSTFHGASCEFAGTYSPKR
jgi:hypothetical protein